jgi:hypothetical protein
MTTQREQNFGNHAQFRPEYHIFVLLVLLVNFAWAVYGLFQGMSGGSIVAFLMSIAFIVMFFSLRVQILTVQDRVIRLEMRHRFRDLLPADVAARATALSLRQIIALRFASDAELPTLVTEVLSGTLTEAKAIKQRVSSWQADHLRA